MRRFIARERDIMSDTALSVSVEIPRIGGQTVRGRCPEKNCSSSQRRDRDSTGQFLSGTSQPVH